MEIDGEKIVSTAEILEFGKRIESEYGSDGDVKVQETLNVHEGLYRKHFH